MSGGPILAGEGLVKHFPAARDALGRVTRTVKAVDHVSLTLHRGETLALVGESGCGKSTLGRLLVRLIEPTAGRVILAGTEITGLRGAGLRPHRRAIQIVFQDPFASLNPRMTVGDALAEPLALHGIVPAPERTVRVGDLLETVGLPRGAAGRYPHEFSGGQRQRVAIARALAVEPAVLVLDEAVSALDVSVRAQVLNLLAELRERLGLAYLFISHDLSVVRHISDRVAVMYLGRIVEEGTAAAVFGDPRHPYTRALLGAIPGTDPAARAARPPLPGDVPSPIDPPPGCHLHPRCPHAREVCAAERPALTDDGTGHPAACHFWPELPPARDDAPEPAPDPRLRRLLDAFAAAG